MGEAQRDEIAKLEALYAANPEGRVFTHLAEAYRKAGNLERSREILESGLDRHPDSATAYVVLGRVAFDSSGHEGARDAFGRALQLDDGNLVAHRYLGELALAAGDEGGARQHFGELLARNPMDESILARMRELSERAAEGPNRGGDAPALAIDPSATDEGPLEEPAPETDASPPETVQDEPRANWTDEARESEAEPDVVSTEWGEEEPAGDEFPGEPVELAG